MIITFCGHSDFRGSKEYEEKILKLLERNAGNTFAKMYLGGHGGFDSFAYDCCRKYKETHPNVALLYITPYMTVEYQRNHLEEYKKKYDGIIYPEIEKTPLRYAILARNKWMAEKADCVICAVTHSFGGAYKTYQHAKRRGKPIFNIMDESTL